MTGDYKLLIRPFHIPVVRFAVPEEEFIPAVAPRGTATCLEGTTFYVGLNCGGYHVFSLQDVKKLILEHGGRIGKTKKPRYTYVIGTSPHQDFMEGIASYKQITLRKLFDKISDSVQQEES